MGKSGAFSVKDVNRVLKGVLHKSGLDAIRGFSAKCLHRGFEWTLNYAENYSRVLEILWK